MHPSNEPREVLDRYYTPDWLATKLVELLPPVSASAYGLEPHVGDGAFLSALMARCAHVTACDLDTDSVGLDYWGLQGRYVGDFAGFNNDNIDRYDLIVGNPPFAEDTGRVSPKTGRPITRPIAMEHVEHALGMLAPGGVAGFLLPLSMLSGVRRSRFWRRFPAFHVWVLPKRVRFSGALKSSMQDYMWVCWRHGYKGVTGLTNLPEGWQT